MTISNGFRPAPLLADKDVREARARALAKHRPTIRGIFFSDLVREAKSLEVHSEQARRFYLPFRNYSTRDYLSLLDEYAERCFSQKAREVALYEMGLRAFPTFRATTLGGTVCKAIGDDPLRILSAVPRVYRLSTSHTRVHEVRKGASYYHARLENVFSEAGAYEVGAWDGALKSIGIDAKFSVRVRGLTGIEFYITW